MMDRRDFLRSVGAGTALLAAGPYATGVGRADESQVLDEAEDRIRKRMRARLEAGGCRV